ncbi:MAG: hypothetical protein EOM34_00615 [Clostridia bacterium]|nr:hypothetical protein [Clostridia bacterium]
MFNLISMTRLAASIAESMGVEAPEKADVSIPQVTDLVKNTLGGKADRVLIYNPDAIGMWLFQKYTKEFAPVMEKVQLTLPVATVMPSVTPVCFGTMYTGALPEVHGIQKYEKPVIKTDSLFDALARAGKKVALVAVDESSMALIFKGRDIDYYLMPYDGEAVDKALELIDQDNYDVIVVYNQEYDDVMHDTHPESEISYNAMLHQINFFAKLTDAVKEKWTSHDSLVVWATDHGIHTREDGHGDHGLYIEDDINITHFYGAYPKK